MNLYEILDIPETASNKEIRDAYRKLAKEYHPDKLQGVSNIFKEIQEAYEILKDDYSKAKYDQSLIEEKNVNPSSRSSNASSTNNRSQNNQKKRKGWKSIGLGFLLGIIGGILGLSVLALLDSKISSTGTDINTDTSITVAPTVTIPATKESYINSSVQVPFQAIIREPSKYKFSEFEKPILLEGYLHSFFKNSATGDVYGGSIRNTNIVNGALNDNENTIFLTFDKNIDLSKIDINDKLKLYAEGEGVTSSTDASKYSSLYVRYVYNEKNKYFSN